MSKVGDTVTIRATFRADGALVDPTTLALVITAPNGAVTPGSWPPDGVIVRDDLGTFRTTLLLTQAGTWDYVWTASGTSTEVIHGAFAVDAIRENVSIDVHTGTLVPITDALVRVFNASGVPVAGGLTDAAGVYAGRVVPGSYSVVLMHPMASFPISTPIVVADTGGVTPQVFNVVGVLLPIVDVAPPRLVRLFGYVADSGGAPVGVRVVVESVDGGNRRPFVTPDSGGTGIAPSKTMVRVEKRELVASTATGYWECDVIAGASYRVRVPDVGFDLIARIPNVTQVTTVNVRDLRPDPGDGGSIGVTSDTGTAHELSRGIG